MELDPGIHIVMHSVLSLKTGCGTLPLVKHNAEPSAGGVTVHDELPGEVQHLENQPGRERVLELSKCYCYVRGPVVGVLAQQPHQGTCYVAEVPDELPIVARPPLGSHARPGGWGGRLRPGLDGGHLVAVHGDAIGVDDMA
jgi:hypothetical protein